MLRKILYTWQYLHHPRWDTGTSPPELLAFLLSHPPGRALDLGCGSGTNVITLAQYGWQASGVDFIPVAILKARYKVAQTGLDINLRCADVSLHLDYTQTFDLILDIGCLHGIPLSRRPGYIANLRRLIAPTGVFLLYAFWNQAPPGITQADLAALGDFLTLCKRVDGFDHNHRPSAWFTYTWQTPQILITPGEGK